MPKKILWALVLFFAAALLIATGQEEATGMWKPSKPIQIIVPWGAGGSTDQMTRVVAGELEDGLGQKIVVVNQPGASGSVGTKGALDAPHDGYTWTAGAAALSAGHNSMIAIEKYTGIKYKHVTYDGGNPAVIATVAGECVAVPQLAVEQADMLAGGKLRALAVLDDKPLELEKYGSIPPITKWVPDFVPGPNYFGIWIPKDAPQEVIDTFGKLWDDVMENSEALMKYAASRGAVFDPSWGEEAKKKAMPYLSIIAWNLHEAGQTVMSPAEVGIPKP